MFSLNLILIFVLAVSFSSIQAQFNAECYYAKNQLAGSAIIPCFNTAKGPSSCCQNGDICLSDQSCWSPKTGVTYQYGCTDPNYEDKSCPKKCGLDVEKSNWIGLIYCNDTSNMWACNAPDTCGHCPNTTTWDPAIQKIPDNPGNCQDLKTIKAAFAGPVSLMPSLSLPADVGSSTLYFSPSGSTFIPVTGYLPDWARNTTQSNGLSGDAKIGIGVGVGVGGLAVIMAVVILLLKRRQQKRGREMKAINPLDGGDFKSELPASNEVKPILYEMESPNIGFAGSLALSSPSPETQTPKSPTELNEVEAQIYEMPANRFAVTPSGENSV